MSYATITTTTTHNKECAEMLQHARKVSADAAKIEAVLAELTNEGQFIETGHFEDINTGDRFGMVVYANNHFDKKESKF